MPVWKNPAFLIPVLSGLLVFQSCSSQVMSPVIKSETLPVALPLRMDTNDWCSYLKIEINSNQYEAFLDTGYNSTMMITRQLAEAEQIAGSFSFIYHRTINGLEPLQFRIYHLPLVSLGGVAFTNIREIQGMSQHHSKIGSPVVIGRDFFRRYNYCLDYNTMRLVLFDRGNAEQDIQALDMQDGIRIPFILKNNLVYIALSMEDDGMVRQAHFVLDTGAVMWEWQKGEKEARLFNIVNYNSKFFKSVSKKDRKEMDSYIDKNRLFYTPHEVTLQSGDRPDIGPLLMRKMKFDADGFLGQAFFMKYKVYFDMDNRQLVLKKH